MWKGNYRNFGNMVLLILISARSLPTHLLSKKSSSHTSCGSCKNITTKQSDIQGFVCSCIKAVWGLRKCFKSVAWSGRELFMILFFQKFLWPVHRTENRFLGLADINFFTLFTLSCVNTEIHAIEVLIEHDFFTVFIGDAVCVWNQHG